MTKDETVDEVLRTCEARQCRNTVFAVFLRVLLFPFSCFSMDDMLPKYGDIKYNFKTIVFAANTEALRKKVESVLVAKGFSNEG